MIEFVRWHDIEECILVWLIILLLFKQQHTWQMQVWCNQAYKNRTRKITWPLDRRVTGQTKNLWPPAFAFWATLFWFSWYLCYYSNNIIHDRHKCGANNIIYDRHKCGGVCIRIPILMECVLYDQYNRSIYEMSENCVVTIHLKWC